MQAALRQGGRLPGGAGGGDGGAEGEGALYYIGACLLLCSLAIFYGAVWCRRPRSCPPVDLSWRTAPWARLVAPLAQAAPAQPGVQPQPRACLPWPEQAAVACAEDKGFTRHRCWYRGARLGRGDLRARRRRGGLGALFKDKVY